MTARIDTSPRLVRDLAAGHPRLQVFGNSLSTAHAVPEQHRWGNLLRGYLADRDAPNAVVDTTLARNGSTVADYVDGGQHAALLDQVVWDSSAVLIAFGTNEYLGQMSLQRYADNLDAIAHELRDRAPASTLVFVNMPWSYPTGSQPARPTQQNGYRALTKTIALNHGGLYFAGEYGFPGDNSNGVYAADGIHWTPAGNLLFASALLAWLFGVANLG